MRFLLLVFAVGLSVVSTGCSSSRLVNSQRVLPLGDHTSGTISGSDLLIPAGTSLNVSFSFENRFFIATEGRLTGFGKGARSTKIYAEKRAGLPDANTLGGVRIGSAAEAYRNRSQPLPPLKSRSRMIGGPSSVDHADRYDEIESSSRRPSHLSVTPSSYQKKN